MRSPSVDIGPSLREILHHLELATPRCLPQHRPPMRSNLRYPLGPLLENVAYCLDIAAPCRRHADLHEIADLARQHNL